MAAHFKLDRASLILGLSTKELILLFYGFGVRGMLTLNVLH